MTWLVRPWARLQLLRIALTKKPKDEALSLMAPMLDVFALLDPMTYKKVSFFWGVAVFGVFGDLGDVFFGLLAAK